ncbi:enoyl-CoA hydratase [Meridianimarinicoccus roseus]
MNEMTANTAAAQDYVLREDEEAIACLTLSRPGALNALSDGMLAALRGKLNDIANDPSVRVVVLRGAGKAFCAGHDLKEMTAARDAPDGGAAYFADLFDRCGQLMQAIPRLPQPVIAEVHGIATAAGCQLVATCDMAVAAEGTRFGVNGVNIGLFCSTPMVALSRNVPRKQAFEMLTTGAFIPAERAAEIGLVNRVVAAEALHEETMALARVVASKLGRAVRIGKGAFYDQLERDLQGAYALTRDAMVENMLDRDTAEGIQAFIEKRPPSWNQ